MARRGITKVGGRATTFDGRGSGTLKSGIQFRQTDLKNLQSKIAKMQAYPEESERILRHEAGRAIGKMKRDAPVDTGHLRREVKLKTATPEEVIITSIAIDPVTKRDYAPLHEYGVYPYREQPYFRHNRDLFYHKVTARLRRAIKILF